MAKIEKQFLEKEAIKTKKRKRKEEAACISPSTKFKKLDISQTKKPISGKKKSPTKKRKSTFTEDSTTKKVKTESDNDDDYDNNEIHEPTDAEIAESYKPENMLNIETIRQKKRAKHLTNVDSNKVETLKKDLQRNINYLKNWKYSRDEWKFEKLRQISIQNSLFKFDEDVDDEIWSIMVEYLSGTKGAALAVITKKAEEVINDTDAKITKTNKNELIQQCSYKRARELLQCLQ